MWFRFRPMKSLLLILSFVMVAPTFASECKVSFEQRNAATNLSEESVVSLKENIEFMLALKPGIVIVPREEADFHIVTRLLNWTDHHNKKLHNAFVSLSLYIGKEEKMFSYSHHFGRKKYKERFAGSERNFHRANKRVVKAIKGCDNLHRLARE
jgi:hypothetical protein